MVIKRKNKIVCKEECIRIVTRLCNENIHGHALAKEEGISTQVLGRWVAVYMKQIREKKTKIAN